MDKLYLELKKLLSSKSKIEWLIVHDISQLECQIEGIEYSFVDGEKRIDTPFGTNQGYISLDNEELYESLNLIFSNLRIDFNSDKIALSNLYIILSRISYKREEKEILLDHFLNQLDTKFKNEIFKLIITSLNIEYFKDRHFYNKTTLDTNEWLKVFRSAQYIHNIADPILYTLRLIRKNKSKKLSYSNIKDMNPIIRAVLISWYGFDISISKSDFKSLLKNTNEICFLSAFLVDSNSPDKLAPDWLSKELILVFISNNWDISGQSIFRNVFGISYRNKKFNKLYESLSDLTFEIIWNKMILEDSNSKIWIEKLNFPEDFIALFNMLSDKKVGLSKIPDMVCDYINSQFIDQLDSIYDKTPFYLNKENNDSPFNSFQYSEEKYLTSFAYLSLFLLSMKEHEFRKLKNLCFSYKQLYYGNYNSIYIAKQFTELMLLIVLSIYRITGIDKEGINMLKQILKVISETILIPYIHLLERESEVWSKEKSKGSFQYERSNLIISHMSMINKSKYKDSYADFFNTINEVAVIDFKDVIVRKKIG